MSDTETDEWMPSTEQVRSHYVFNQSNQWGAERGEAFDRWLAAHDAEVRAEAWDEGFADRHGLPEHRTFLGDRFTRNPYRAKQEGATDA